MVYSLKTTQTAVVFE